MRAGSDIGYCDSDYRENNTHSYICDDFVNNIVEAAGFDLFDAQLGEKTLDLYITDKETDIDYDYYDLSYDELESYTRKEFLNNYDQKHTEK